MRKRGFLLRRSIMLLFTLVAAIAISIWLTLRASLPRLDGNITLAVGATVTVERDALGTASIHASSSTDAYYALGFVHAQERFFEMDMMRRMAAGELAELLGAAALPLDREHRPFRFRTRAEQVLAGLKPEEHTNLAAYRDGVNAGLTALGSRPWEYWVLRAEPAAWSDADSVLVLDAMFFDLNDTTNARELGFSKIKNALPESVYKFLSASGGPWDAPLLGPAMAYPPIPPASDIDLRLLDPKLLHVPADMVEHKTIPGSNSFAVAGTLTATHAALVANDMHLNLRVPNIWFRARLTYPSTRRRGEMVDLIGITLPGIPALVAGSNHHVAWGFTNSYGDWMDWVRINLDSGDSSRYHNASGTRSLLQNEEIIKVHNAPDEKLIVRETEWGPILAEDTDGTSLALAWVATQPGGVNIELARLDNAESVDEAMDIANRSGMPPQNFVVGDRAGNIGWTIAGRIPKRSNNYDPQLPADWSIPDTGWLGWLDPADYPHLPNPPAQRLWTANTRVVEGDWLKRIGDGGYDLGARARQIRDDLKAKDKFTPDDMLAIQLDDRALFLEHWHQQLLDTLNRASNIFQLIEMKKYAMAWNGHADPASVGYRLTRAFRQEVVDTLLDGFAAAVRTKYPDFTMPQLSQAETLAGVLLTRRPPHLLPPGYANWDDLLQQCAERIAQRLATQPGGLAARSWGEGNTVNIRHLLSPALPGLSWLLDLPAEQLPGDVNMPRVQGRHFGASERFAVEPGHEEYGYFHMPGGQSDHPLSPFYRAGTADWAQGKSTPFLPGATKYSLQLLPKTITH